ncbi:unnamed protein product [Gemmata massiliana]|uniref:Uncharacterized protein n=1 Tax=Gemmata massiliana TaxID=1210884 RepID=A0A6P2DMJ3_9BACT|nr:hypothetical protein [Gemmata massiliana]VTS03818.1 unnamed protein product [Gemmata massiliana]
MLTPLSRLKAAFNAQKSSPNVEIHAGEVTDVCDLCGDESNPAVAQCRSIAEPVDRPGVLIRVPRAAVAKILEMAGSE